jgi:2OG-Fe(II) oxygenase superfamily
MPESSYLLAGTPSADFHLSDSDADLARTRVALTTWGYVRVDGCFDETLAERTLSELKEDPRYFRIGDELAKDYGQLQYWQEKLSPGVARCCAFLKSPSFLGWLTRLEGHKVQVTRQPSPFKMDLGDRIVPHDDCSDYPSNRFSVVLHFSKGWNRRFGGNTLIGKVKRIETMTSERGGKRRWIFSSQRSVVVPLFNSLVLIALRPSMAHAVTRVRVNHPRLTIIATYGVET